MRIRRHPFVFGAALAVALGSAATEAEAQACAPRATDDTYEIVFDPTRQEFVRPRTAPLAGQQLVLCIPAEPIEARYTLSYGAQVEGEEAPTPTTVGVAPESTAGPRRLDAEPGRETKLLECPVGAAACRRLQEEVRDIERVLQHVLTARDELMELLVHAARRPAGDREGQERVYDQLEGVQYVFCSGQSAPRSLRNGASDPSPWTALTRCEHAQAGRTITLEGWVDGQLAAYHFHNGHFVRRVADPSRAQPEPRDRQAPDPTRDAEAALDAREVLAIPEDAPRENGRPYVAVRFQIRTEATYRLRAESDMLDPVLEVYGANGALLAANDDVRYPEDLSSEVAVDLEPGTYVARVLSFWPEGRGAVTLRIEERDRPDDGDDGGAAPEPSASAVERRVRAEVAMVNRRNASLSRLQGAVTAYNQTLDFLQRLRRRDPDSPLRIRFGEARGGTIVAATLRRHELELSYDDDRRRLELTARPEPHSLSLEVGNRTWFQLQLGAALSSIESHGYALQSGAEGDGNVLVRESSSLLVEPAVFATVFWCGQDLNHVVYERSCGSEDTSWVPLLPTLAVGVPLSSALADGNFYLGLSLPYIPYVSILAGLHLARVRRPIDGAVGRQTMATSLEDVTELQVRTGGFVAVALTDELLRALFGRAEAAQ